MRLSLFALLLILVVALPVFAGQPAVEAPALRELPKVDDQNPLSPKEQQSPVGALDDLFAQLHTQTDDVAGRRVAQQIWAIWNKSASATTNLMMGWAGEAMAQDRYALAEDLLTQVIVLEPGYAEGWNRRATLYFGMGNIGASVSDIERTLQLEPRHFGALSGLGIILEKTGQDRKALEIWNKVLSIYPANAQAQRSVIELEEKLAGQGT